uniref:Isoform D of Protein Smaug n=1 Tax=Drosophila melanogaster TaxID=7227 RepID=Q23972-2|nr:smaug, isoform D [Drosophila melanogaster]ACL83279.1 smaug, isoform D [Drosophila melanogaster]|eukprot:NP_001137924.1 smaug, isoform D [Drosophila melanogaster]
MKYATGTDNAMTSGISGQTNNSNSASNEMQPTTSTPTAAHKEATSTATTTATYANGNPNSNANPSQSQPSNALFCEQVTTVTNLFEKWNDCERTVVMYALLKRLRYPSLKFLQYSIDSNLTQNLGTSQTNLSSVVIDINANNPVYLQNLLNAYKTFQPCDLLDAMSSSSSDKDSMPCYGSDFQITTSAQCDERKLYARKEDILHEVLNMLPLLKPGNEEAKLIYLTLIPVAVKDTMQQIVPTELVQQIFSYLLIHPAITSEDRRSLNIWLRHLEDHIQAAAAGLTNRSYFLQPSPQLVAGGSSTGSGSCSSSATSSSTASCSSVASSSLCPASGSRSSRTNDWQTIAPPSKQLQNKLAGDWRGNGGGSSSGSINPLCDNLNGITLNELASSQNSLGLSLEGSSSLVNGVVAGAGSMLGIAGGDDHDTSFSKNGTEILDFDPVTADMGEACSLASSSLCGRNGGNPVEDRSQPPPNLQQQLLQPPPYASILMGNVGDQFGEINRWSLDSKIAALKTRRSNSLTTQTISSCSSSSNSSVITVNDNCSNSTENLAQFANKPRSFSLSIEHQRGALMNSGSDTRLDEFKPNYIKFHTRNVGMSGIGLWLKSLRLHKYIELFKNMTYEEMLLITEDFLQSVGVTKGASHKLALCIDKLKERANILNRVEQELLSGQMELSTAVEELTNIVLTPMKPLESPGPPEENIGLRFLKVIDIVTNTLQQDPYAVQDDETLGVLMWILDRSIHNEAFMNHASQLKDLKFKLSKMKISMVPKMHHVKPAGVGPNNGNINKPRWNGKTRKCDTKNGSNDRINNRKNSNDMLNFSLNCLPHPLPHHSQQAPPPLPQFDYNGYGGGPSHQPQYKSSSYPSFMGNPQQQPPPPPSSKSHHHPQQMQQMLQQHNHFPALPQQTPPQSHRRSLNNLILVAGGPQQPQQLIFKPGQGVLTNNGSNDNLVLERNQQSQQQQQQRKLSGGVSSAEQQPKKTMAAVVMVSNPNQNQDQHDQPQILINNNNNNSMLNNNLINQQQLQLLAAAAAAVGSGSCLCSNGGGGACVHNICHQSSKNNNHGVDHCLSQSPLGSLGMSPHVTEYKMNDFKSLEQLETLCRQMTEQAMN